MLHILFPTVIVFSILTLNFNSCYFLFYRMAEKKCVMCKLSDEGNVLDLSPAEEEVFKICK